MQQQQAPKTISALPTRPKRSDQLKKVSRPIDLVSNHFRVSFINAKEKINVYTLDILPQIERDARDLKNDIMASVASKIKELGLTNYQVKGFNIWSPIYIQEAINIKSPTLEYTIQIKHVRTFSYEDFSSDIDKKVRNPAIQAVNVAIKHSLHQLGFKEIGRNSKYYDPRTFNQNRIQDAGMRVWRGFKTSLCMFNSVPYCLIDFSSRVLRDQTALNYMNNLRGNQRDIAEQMIGLSVISPYGNYRIYRIDDIDFKQTPMDTFQLQDGTRISYIDYYWQKYKLQFKDKKQPLLISYDKRNPDKKFMLIPELMNMTGMTDEQRRDFRLMKDVSQYTKLEPEQRNQEVMKMQGLLQQELKTRNIRMDNDQRVNGFQLDPPTIKLGNQSLKNDTGFFILKDNVLKAGYIKDWFLVYQSRGKNDDEDADFLVDKLKKNASRIGIKMEDPYFIVQKGTDPNSWVKELDAEIKKGGKPQMIVTFIPERDKDRLYTPLKNFCLSTVGISHQNILVKFLKNKNPDSVASKIVQQMNVKIGMPIWSVPRPPQVSAKTMLIGIDIYHKLVSGNKSCMGIVSSLDSEFTQYYSRVLLMSKGTEMAIEIAGIIEQAIKAYYEFNQKKFLPDTIIVYRDGVGEGQVQTLIDTEVNQVKQSFKRIDPNYTPQFAEIMINKKINHRFFAVGGGDQQRPQSSRGAKGGPRNMLVNPPTGTIVADKVVTESFDFFLCAQYVTQGTCTPTHFIVLENNTNWSEETFWMLTYYQCFNYMNWSGAVRVPACVQYAHKLSYLIGDTFQKDLNKNMERLLCYL